MNKFSLVTLILFYGSKYLNLVNSEVCLTPLYQQGTCKPIKSCTALYDLLKNPTLTVVSFLKKSQCGREGDAPKVCCPDIVLDLDNLNDDINSTSGAVYNLLPNNEICGVFTEEKIIGGENVFIGDFPFNALLKYENSNKLEDFYCGGTIISERYILTAAHCIRGLNLPKKSKLISVCLGEHNLDTYLDCEEFAGSKYCLEPYVEIEVEEAIVHEDYDPLDLNRNHDIALVRLKNKIIFNAESIAPVCLPIEVDDLDETVSRRKEIKFAGWGIYNNQIANTQKKQARLTLTNNCKRILNLNLTKNQFCGSKLASYKSCSGDSGGALLYAARHKNNYVNYYVSGILSVGSCNQDQPLVFTKVKSYLEWIVSKLKP